MPLKTRITQRLTADFRDLSISDGREGGLTGPSAAHITPEWSGQPAPCSITGGRGVDSRPAPHVKLHTKTGHTFQTRWGVTYSITPPSRFMALSSPSQEFQTSSGTLTVGLIVYNALEVSQRDWP